MAEVNQDRNLMILLKVSGISLVAGTAVGGIGFAMVLGAENVALGLRTGALVSQTVVWGSVIFLGVGHWVYEAIKESRASGQPGPGDLALNVDPNLIERPLEQAGAGAASQAPAAGRADKFEEVSI